MRRRRERRSPRLRGHDYARPGLYFVTIVAADRACVLGHVDDDRVILLPLGKIADACWRAIPDHHRGVGLDAFVVMPNHVHGLIALTGRDTDDRTERDDRRRDRIYPVPTAVRSAGVSLSTVVGTYKAAVTRIANRRRGTPGAALWQTRFHDRIVRLRDRDELHRIRRHIAASPAGWARDRERPDA